MFILILMKDMIMLLTKFRFLQTWITYCIGQTRIQKLCKDNPEIPPDTSNPVDENSEFFGVFSYKLGEHNLLYVGSIDGVISNEILTKHTILANDIKFAELKTGKRYQIHERNHSFYLRRAKTWCQSFLSCVEKVLFGYRTENGILENIEEYTLDELLEVVGNKYNNS
ncbi:decapping nuclease RAI1-like isoform X2 [Belonocnema kinseyi]|uniref:decapping nuclease RAI1-like isoform X2 n=1 Tax=Belonocnema kinseyi TaxID=2817044 RepID=UPI00143D7269|nr:decapping nuclease RAI1-like isoform X2 [Belonocnema kinseyi]